MVGRIGRIFTALGLVLLVTAWIWWLYSFRSTAAIDCLYLPGASCPPAANLPSFVTLPPYNPLVLWIGAAAALLGAIIRIASRA